MTDCNQTAKPVKSSLVVYPLRFGPGTELKSALYSFVKEQGLKAAFVLTCCGNLQKCRLRLAHGADGLTTEWELEETLELLSLTGTVLGKDGHLHIVLGRVDGSTMGGHVLGDLIVLSTAEVVLGEASDTAFSRSLDPETGFPELVIKPRDNAP